MKVCYIVYREDNVMVFESQVLEYLKKMRYKVEHVELIVFRHERNMLRKKKLENRILEYVDECVTFASLPVVSTFQIKLDAVRLRNYVHKKYKDEQVAVICRGDLAAYVGAYAFRQVSRARVLFDNRGLPQEESILSHGNQWIHKRNRGVKAYAMNYAKDHCDAYNFVTTNLREYDIEQYGYHKDLPFTIVPTLYSNEKVDNEGMERIIRDENCEPDDYIVTYIGSTAAWQSTGKLAEIFQRIYNKKNNARFFVLTNGSIPEIQELQEKLKQRIVVKEVPHNDVKYYLRITDVGIVIRDSNIVNRVAAPTKIAEYVTSGVQLLYSGKIGILSDLSKIRNNDNMIEIDTTPNWEELLRKRDSNDDLSAYDFHICDSEGCHYLNEPGAEMEYLPEPVLSACEEIIRNPSYIYNLKPWEFEEFVADVFRNMGFIADVTQRTRDGGKDIVATFEKGGVLYTTYFECKKYAPDRLVGVGIVREFFAVMEKERVDKGVIVTTSHFTRDAIAEAKQLNERVKLIDIDELYELIREINRIDSRSKYGREN